jgi:hypothetical protein
VRPCSGCAAVVEDLDQVPRRFVTVLFGGVAERRYSADPGVVVRHAHAMLDERRRGARAAA